MLSWYARHPKLVDGVHRTTNSGCSGRPPGPQFLTVSQGWGRLQVAAYADMPLRESFLV
jgi:hypothetical protein